MVIGHSGRRLDAGHGSRSRGTWTRPLPASLHRRRGTKGPGRRCPLSPGARTPMSPSLCERPLQKEEAIRRNGLKGPRSGQTRLQDPAQMDALHAAPGGTAHRRPASIASLTDGRSPHWELPGPEGHRLRDAGPNVLTHDLACHLAMRPRAPGRTSGLRNTCAGRRSLASGSRVRTMRRPDVRPCKGSVSLRTAGKSSAGRDRGLLTQASCWGPPLRPHLGPQAPASKPCSQHAPQ